jgi:predicted amidophosphoribosyltransferase
MAGVSSLARSLLDLVFPPRCVNRHTLGALLCERRPASIAIRQSPLCARYGRPTPTLHADHPCDLGASDHGPVHLTSLRAATVYAGATRAALLEYNFHAVRRLADPLSEMLANAYKREGLAADLATHVPLCRARRRQRGYERSQLLARTTARRLDLPLLPDAVKRRRATEAQTRLSGADRIMNVAQTSALANMSIIARRKDRRVLLIDHVTGGALDATAAALAEAPRGVYRPRAQPLKRRTLT